MKPFYFQIFWTGFMLQGKKILIGVSGSIAAYKSALLIRLLTKEGAEVQVIMSQSAQDFITPLTLATLSKNPVHTQFFDPTNGVWVNHVALAAWADAYIIVPASAHTISKLANGICDNLLVAAYLSATCPIFVAPAMDLDMYAHKSVQNNLHTLVSFGNTIIDAECGELASGMVGVGRMAEPENIVEVLKNIYKKKTLTGKKIMLTAGPTQEQIDPVRYITNYSSGKMGIALAEILIEMGAELTIILGPISLGISHLKCEILHVKTAEEMYTECKKFFNLADVAIFAAAVADYRIKNIAPNKIKKQDQALSIDLVQNIDIAAEFGKIKKEKQLSIGFALETSDELANAKSKLIKKNFDMIIHNSTNDAQSTFGYETNKVTILTTDGQIIPNPLQSKHKVAEVITQQILKMIQ